jgi:predicted nucleotidyltransferase component of viral defense system
MIEQKKISQISNKTQHNGGTALRRCHYEDYRFSEDLDFSLTEEIGQDVILSEFSKIFSWVKDESGITFEHVRQDSPSENT